MEILSSILNFIAPNSCVICAGNSPGAIPLCPPCRLELPWIANPCQGCSLPLSEVIVGTEFPLCGQCLRSPPTFDHCIACFTFSRPIDKLIRDYKHRGHQIAGKLLSSLLANHLQRVYLQDSATRDGTGLPDIITPMPLHWSRLISRGFNQAALIAAQVGSQLNIPVMQISSRRYGARQQGATRVQRQKNVKGVFCVQKNPAGSHIAIVDDVITTGSTANEFSSELKKAGAERVDIWAVARTVGSN